MDRGHELVLLGGGHDEGASAGLSALRFRCQDDAFSCCFGFKAFRVVGNEELWTCDILR